MNAHPLASRLAVCSWSLQPSSPQALLAAIKATGVHRVQLALDPLRESPELWGRTQRVADIAAAREMVEGIDA